MIFRSVNNTNEKMRRSSRFETRSSFLQPCPNIGKLHCHRHSVETTSVKLEMQAAAQSPQFSNSVNANLNGSPCSRIVVIVEELPLLLKLKFNENLYYVLYCMNQSSEVQLLFRIKFYLCSKVVVKLITVLHRSRLWSAVTLLYDLWFPQYICRKAADFTA